MRTRYIHEGPLAQPGAILWEAEAGALRCLAVDEHAWSLGFSRERWLREEGFLARTVFAPDQELFLTGCRAAVRGARFEERCRARAADGCTHWVALALEGVELGHERWLRGRMVKRPPGGPLMQGESPLIIAHFDRELRHLYVNREVSGVTGLPARLFIGRTNEQLGMPPKLTRQWRSVLQRSFQREEASSFEFEFPCMDGASPGEPSLFQAHLRPVFDSQGRVRSVRCETYRRAPSRRRPCPSTRAGAPPAPEPRPEGATLLARLHRRLCTSTGPEELLHALGPLVGTELGDWCDVELMRAGGLERAASFRSPGGRVQVPPGEAPAPMARRVALTGASEWFSSRSGQGGAALAPDEAWRLALQDDGLLDCLVVPMRLGERILGVLVFATRNPAVRFGTDTLALAESVAGLVAWTLEVHRLRQGEHASRSRTAEMEQRIHRFRQLVMALGETRSPSQVAEVIRGKVAQVLSARTARVYQLEPGGQGLELLGPRDSSETGIGDVARLPLELRSPVTDALKLGEPQWLGSPAEFRRRYCPRAERVTLPAEGAWGAVPLMLEGRPLGVLALGFDTCRDFQEEERGFALSVSRQCAQALERTRLLQALEQSRVDDALRKEAEQRADGLTRELRRQVMEIQTLLDVIPVGIGIARDPECRNVQQNAWLAHLLEVPVETNVSLSAPEAERPQGLRVLRGGRELRPEELPLQQAAKTGREVLDVEFDVELWGRRLTLLASAVPLFDEAHQPRGAIASFLDITSRTRAMQAQRFLAESSAVLSSSLDQEQTFQMLARLCVPVLASMAMLFGARDESSLGVLSVAHAEPERESLLVRAGQHFHLTGKHPLHEVIRTGQPQLLPAMEGPGLWEGNEDPEWCHVRERLALRSVMLIPISSHQRVTNVLVLGSSERAYTPDDCTFAQEFAAHAAFALDNARLYREAREAVALRDEFLGIAGHELRTPLTALKLGLQSLARQAPAGAEQERLAKWITHCQRQGERLGRLVNDLLDVGLLTSRRLPLVYEELDLSALVEEVVARMGPELEQAGCGVSLALEAPLTGRWDRSRLDQVLTNLLSNAAKYGKCRPIEVCAQALPGDRVRVSVRDEGIGISPQDQARIFGRFERAVSDRHYGGLGLGLWITQQIVLRFGGHIGVCSEQGKGSTFTVELPRQGEAEGAGLPRCQFEAGQERTAVAEATPCAETDALYGSILAALWEGIVLQDSDGAILSANASAERMLGLSLDQLKGRTSMDPRWRAIREDGSDFPGSEHPAMVALRTGRPVRDVTMGVQRPDGSRVWLAVNAQPLQRDGEPAPYRVVSSFFDITGLRRAPGELPSEER